MRGFVALLLVSIPISAATVSVNCNGVVYQGTDSASCGSQTTAGSYAEASEGAVFASVWGDGGSSAFASFTQDYIFTVTGAYGNGFAQPLLMVGGDSFGSFASAGGSASLGGCELNSNWGGGYSYCSPGSIPFVFGTPQTLTLSLSAGASSNYRTPPVDGEARWSGFAFFDAYGRPLSDFSYTFWPISQTTPEPSTLFLTAMACAALIVFHRRRMKR
jgi:hypothetical protein